MRRYFVTSPGFWLRLHLDYELIRAERENGERITGAAVESWPLTTPEVAIWRMKKDAVRAANGDAAEIKRTEEQWPLYGSNLGYHYDGSGRFFIRLGDECAAAMLKVMGKKRLEPEAGRGSGASVARMPFTSTVRRPPPARSARRG